MNFYDEFFEPLLRPISNDWLGWSMLILIWIVVLFVVGIIIYGIVMLIDFAFLPVSEEYGEVVSTVFTPGHTETTLTYDASLKMSVPKVVYHPDRWEVNIQVGDKTGSMGLSQEDFLKLHSGQKVWVAYSIGRLLKRLYIKQIN
jgi:hypothetical protein